MANFPRLTTGAVTQYPSSRNMTYSTHVLRFVDGREQRFRELGGPVRSWVVKLHQLSAEEMGALEIVLQRTSGAVRIIHVRGSMGRDGVSGLQLRSAGPLRSGDGRKTLPRAANYSEQQAVSTLYFPQLATGTMCQFPSRKDTLERTRAESHAREHRRQDGRSGGGIHSMGACIRGPDRRRDQPARGSVRRLRRTVTNLYVRGPLWEPVALDRGLIEPSVGVVDADRSFE